VKSPAAHVSCRGLRICGALPIATVLEVPHLRPRARRGRSGTHACPMLRSSMRSPTSLTAGPVYALSAQIA
jgi:hypothetical protein